MTCQGQKFFCETPVRQALVSDQTGLFPGSPKGVGIALKLPNHFIFFPGLSQQPLTWKGYAPARQLHFITSLWWSLAVASPGLAMRPC